jgi:hypothetical protein
MDSGHQIMRPPGSREDIHIEWRVMMACWLAAHSKRLVGDFVECGVNTGITSLAICEYINFNTLDRTFYLFDTYQGIPESSMSSREREARLRENKMMYPDCFEQATRNFAPFPRARLIRGQVPDSLTTVSIEACAYLHLDMNVAKPERAAIEHFWPKMPSGAPVLLDDYGWMPYREQKESLDDFAKIHGVEIMTLPTGQGLLIKS